MRIAAPKHLEIRQNPRPQIAQRSPPVTAFCRFDSFQGPIQQRSATARSAVLRKDILHLTARKTGIHNMPKSGGRKGRPAALEKGEARGTVAATVGRPQAPSPTLPRKRPQTGEGVSARYARRDRSGKTS